MIVYNEDYVYVLLCAYFEVDCERWFERS